MKIIPPCSVSITLIAMSCDIASAPTLMKDSILFLHAYAPYTHAAICGQWEIGRKVKIIKGVY